MWSDERPCVAVTGPDHGGALAWLFTWYALRRAGARPLRIRPGNGKAATPFDALIIGGGADVDPDLYGQQPLLKAVAEQSRRRRGAVEWLLYPLLFLLRKLFSTRHYSGLDRERDALEAELLRRAWADGVPILGICRGAQLINVIRDGDLHQDISGFYSETPQQWSIRPIKHIEIERDSHLHAVLGTERCKVNGLHRQAIDRAGDGLRVCACEDNGVVQAIEAVQDEFVIGVQWHPEYLPHLPRQRRLFKHLVEVAVKRRAVRDRSPTADCA